MLEFKHEVIRLVHRGETVATVAKSLGISCQMLHHWVKANAAGRLREFALKFTDVKAEDGSIRDEFVPDKSQTKRRKSWGVFPSSKLKKELAAYIVQVKLRSGCNALFQSQKGEAFSAIHYASYF